MTRAASPLLQGERDSFFLPSSFPTAGFCERQPTLDASTHCAQHCSPKGDGIRTAPSLTWRLPSVSLLSNNATNARLSRVRRSASRPAAVTEREDGKHTTAGDDDPDTASDVPLRQPLAGAGTSGEHDAAALTRGYNSSAQIFAACARSRQDASALEAHTSRSITRRGPQSMPLPLQRTGSQGPAAETASPREETAGLQDSTMRGWERQIPANLLRSWRHNKTTGWLLTDNGRKAVGGAAVLVSQCKPGEADYSAEGRDLGENRDRQTDATASGGERNDKEDDLCCSVSSGTGLSISRASTEEGSTHGKASSTSSSLRGWSFGVAAEYPGSRQSASDAKVKLRDLQAYTLDVKDLEMGPVLMVGSSGEVSSAVYKGRKVAVKILRKTLQGRSCQTELNRELKSLALCNGCPHVVPFIGSFVGRLGEVGIVTEFMPGGNLRTFLRARKGSALPPGVVLQMAKGIAEGLAFIHQAGLIHRDLKSDNILLNSDNSPVLCDFGTTRDSDSGNDMTNEVGTYRWMAPEAYGATGWPITNKVDVYSFGVVLWELVALKLPFADLSDFQVACKVGYKGMRLEVPSPCTPALAKLMQQCWASNPNHRPNFVSIVRTLHRM